MTETATCVRPQNVSVLNEKKSGWPARWRTADITQTARAANVHGYGQYAPCPNQRSWWNMALIVLQSGARNGTQSRRTKSTVRVRAARGGREKRGKRAAHSLCAAKPNPCSPPHRMKFQLAPCHKPP